MFISISLLMHWCLICNADAECAQAVIPDLQMYQPTGTCSYEDAMGECLCRANDKYEEVGPPFMLEYFIRPYDEH